MTHTKYSRRKFISDSTSIAAGALAFTPSRVLSQTSGNGNIIAQNAWPSETGLDPVLQYHRQF
jgi:hypothetical protein